MLKEFQTHTGEIISGPRLVSAFDKVADFFKDNANAIYLEDAYASHVTKLQKDKILKESLEQAERIRSMIEPVGFWLWQRVNTELTGECIALLPK